MSQKILGPLANLIPPELPKKVPGGALGPHERSLAGPRAAQSLPEGPPGASQAGPGTPQRRLGTSQGPPRDPQGGPRALPGGPQGGPGTPRAPQGPSKDPQGAPRDAPRTSQMATSYLYTKRLAQEMAASAKDAWRL